uniref:Uncharacterized protein n=1 Tax=Fagus sylvatica TaxID=28930 RepID=A0A2N9EEG1_FAGSY
MWCAKKFEKMLGKPRFKRNAVQMAKAILLEGGIAGKGEKWEEVFQNHDLDTMLK